jgi:hypothetical protein
MSRENEQKNTKSFKIWLGCPEDLSGYRYRILKHDKPFTYTSTPSKNKSQAVKVDTQAAISACQLAVFGVGFRNHPNAVAEYELALKAKLPTWTHDEGKTYGDLAKWLTEVSQQ